MGRRLFTILSTIGLLISLPGTAHANKPINFTDSSINVFCPDSLVGQGGVAQLFQATFSQQFGAFGDVAFWEGQSEPNGDPTLATDFDTPAQGTGDDSSLSITIPLIVVATGEPDGVATVDATLIPAGDPEPYEFHDRFGNHQVRESGSFQPMAIQSGTLQIAGESLSLGDCVGFRQVVTHHFESQPNSLVFDIADTQAFCDLSSGNAHATIFAFADEHGGFVEVHAEPPAVTGATEDVVLTLDAFSATVPMFDDQTGDQVEDATIDGTVHAGEVIHTVRRSQFGSAKGTAQSLSFEGTLDVPAIGATFDLSGCGGLKEDQHFVFTNPRGPKPGGTPPINDTPDGALALSSGDRDFRKTGGASVPPEEPTSCEVPIPELGVGRTVWYTVVGTGDTLTVDTAGSDFDTVVAVYTKNDGFSEVVCDDDIFVDQIQVSLQAAVTIETEPGVTYYVQIGGFASEFGNLKVHVT